MCHDYHRHLPIVRAGDWRARAILFVKALRTETDLVECYRAIATSPAPILAICNCRLLDALESDVGHFCYTQRTVKVSNRDRNELFTLITKDAPLGVELRRELSRSADDKGDASRYLRIRGLPEPIPAEGESPIP